jgi:hypothetical protein
MSDFLLSGLTGTLDYGAKFTGRHLMMVRPVYDNFGPQCTAAKAINAFKAE